jgi:hypothetical protein
MRNDIFLRSFSSFIDSSAAVRVELFVNIMIDRFSTFARAVLLLLIIATLSLPAVAQKQTSSSAKSSKSVNESCDGALDIVPSKPVTFVRKRRPSKSEVKQPHSQAPPTNKP